MICFKWRNYGNLSVGCAMEMCQIYTRHQRIRGITGENFMEKKKEKNQRNITGVTTPPPGILNIDSLLLCGASHVEKYIY